jgi:hypothetical protein
MEKAWLSWASEYLVDTTSITLTANKAAYISLVLGKSDNDLNSYYGHHHLVSFLSELISSTHFLFPLSVEQLQI